MAGGSEKVIGLAYHNKGYEGDEKDLKYTKGINITGGGGGGEENGVSKILNSNDSEADKDEIGPATNREGTNEWKNTSKDDGELNKKDKRRKEEEDAVPDGGWGWIVAAGGFLGQLQINMLLSGFGILYSNFLLDLGTSAVVSSWIFNLMGFMMTFMGMTIKGLVDELGLRVSTFLASFFLFVGITATVFANSPWFLMFFFSFVAGIGNGILAPLTYSVVPFYFKRRLGIANAIMSSGVSAGQIVGPPLITLLMEQYAFKGAVIILGAIMLHSCIGATVFHPVEWHKKRPRYVAKRVGDSQGICHVVLRIFKNTLNNLKLVKSPKAVIIAIGISFNVIGYINFLTILPFMMQEAGFTVQEAANCVSVSGITNLILRLIVSVMSDASWFDLRYCFMAGTAIVGVLSVAFCFLTDLTSITILIAFWGFGVGAYMGLFNLIMVKYMGIENLLAQLAFSNFVSSMWFLACGPLLGAIRDTTGSYTNSIFTLAGSFSITFILYLLMPLAEAYEDKHREQMKKIKILP